MGRIAVFILALFVLTSFTGPGDPPEVGISFNSFWKSKSVAIAGYTKINARYEWVAGAFDSGLHVPQYNGVPSGRRSGVWNADGAIAADTANNKLYLYSGGAWNQVGTTYTSSNGITLTGSNFKLGGTLVENTTIDAGNNTLEIGNMSQGIFKVGSGSIFSLLDVDNGTAAIGSYKNSDYADIIAYSSPQKPFIELNVLSNTDGYFQQISLDSNSIVIRPDRGSFIIDSLNYTLSTTGKKIMLRDTATGLVQNIDPALIAGTTYTFPYSVTAPGNAVQLENDTIPFSNGVYTFNSAGRRTWQPISAITVATTGSSIIEKPNGIVRITDSAYYTAFAFSVVTNDTIHYFASQGQDHNDRMWLVHYWSVDGLKTVNKQILYSHPDTSFRDAGGGVGPDGQIYLFVTKYTYTSPGIYISNAKINLYKGINTSFPIYQYSLPMNGCGAVTSYGKMITVGDTLMMTAYGDNVKVFTYKSTVGGSWIAGSTIYNGADNMNETCIEVLSDSTIIAVGRVSGLAPKMLVSHNAGITWTNWGALTYGATNNVSPWLQNINDSTLGYVFADRNAASYLLTAFEYNANYLDTAQSSTATLNAFLRKKVIYEPILNNRPTTAGVGGHYGYPSVFSLSGKFYVLFNDLNPLQDAPIGGDDNVTTDIIVVPYKGRVILRAYNSATENFAPDVETRVLLPKVEMDTWGILDVNNNITIPKDGMYAFGAAYTLNNGTGGRRIIMVRKVAANDTTTTTYRKTVTYKEYSPGSTGHYQTVDCNTIYYFQKGEVIKFSFLIYGASGNVSTVFTQQLGGNNEGIYNGIYVYGIDPDDDE